MCMEGQLGKWKDSSRNETPFLSARTSEIYVSTNNSIFTGKGNESVPS